jgi:putative transcriptional regulator
MKYKSEIYEAIHQDAIADLEVGAISETRMREYDEMCLISDDKTACKAETPAEVKKVIV